MPISMDKDQTFRIVLKTDQGKSKKLQPYFEFRFLTNREFKKLADVISDVEQIEGKNLRDILTKLEEAITIPLVGWGKMNMKYNPKKIDELLTPDEIKELLAGVLEHTTPSNKEKKASKSRAR